jgi:hypothetical protein
VQLLVVGSHRSGTSLLTQLLHSGGLFVGDDLLGALPSNPYGHFEDREVLELHREIMSDHGVNWQVDEVQEFYIAPRYWRQMQEFAQKRAAKHRNWGFKDPRVCLFLGAWKYVLPDARFVIVYRDPADCVRSMESRQAGDYFRGAGNAEHHLRFFNRPDHGLRLWDVYNRSAVAFARRHLDDCLVLPFTHLQSGYPVIRRINERFGGDLQEVSTEAVFDANVTDGRRYRQWVHDAAVAARVTATWRNLEELSLQTEAAL